MLQNRKSDPARLAGDIMRWLDRPLVLVGLMGVGKSTVGKRLANDLGIGFVDADEEIEKAASSDLDNPPLTDEELEAFERVPDTKAIRTALRLTQHEFATTFQLSLATVRDWEQGRYQPDQAARTLLRIIARDPKAVKRALETS